MKPWMETGWEAHRNVLLVRWSPGGGPGRSAEFLCNAGEEPAKWEEASATLAAAAPDLYRALDNAQKMIDFMREKCLLHQDTKHATEGAHDVSYEALNALRIARGE